MRIEAQRDHLIGRMRQAVTERRYKAQAEIGVQLRAVTLRKLQIELAAERKMYRSLTRSTGPGLPQKAAACRQRAQRIAQKIQERTA
jgi:hypothetical protein